MKAPKTSVYLLTSGLLALSLALQACGDKAPPPMTEPPAFGNEFTPIGDPMQPLQPDPNAGSSFNPVDTPQGNPPSRPTGLKVKYVDPETFELSWNPAQGAQSYFVVLNDTVLAAELAEPYLTVDGAEANGVYVLEVGSLNAVGRSAQMTKITVRMAEITPAAGTAPEDIVPEQQVEEEIETPDDLETVPDTATQSPDPSPTATATTDPTASPTATADPTASPTATTDPSSDPSPTATPTATATPTPTPTPTPTATPANLGNAFLGFVGTPQMEDMNGLAVTSAQMYMTFYKPGSSISNNNLSVRRFALVNGATSDATVWGQFFGKPGVELSGVAANSNNGEYWTVSKDLLTNDKTPPNYTNNDDFNLYRFNSSGERVQRYRVGTKGIVLNDVAVDSSSGVVYIVSPSTQSLIRFNPSNTSETNMFFSGVQTVNPVGLGLDANGDIYVSDATSRRVIKYAKADGAKLAEFGAGQNLNSIGDVAVDPRNGDVYVLGNSGSGMRIFRFNSQGTFVHSFTHQNLSQPQKMAVGANGHVHVVERNQKAVMSFDAGN